MVAVGSANRPSHVAFLTGATRKIGGQICPGEVDPMANIIGVPFFILVMILAWVIGAAMVNDGACDVVTTHPAVFRVVEEFLMLCRWV